MFPEAPYRRRRRFGALWVVLGLVWSGALSVAAVGPGKPGAGPGESGRMRDTVADQVRRPGVDEGSSRGRKSERGAVAGEAMEVLQRNCFGCHNATDHRGGLDLTRREAMLAGGDSGKVVIARKPAKSQLWSLLSAEGDPHMPPKRQLSDRQRESVERWIQAGMPWDDAVLARLNAPRAVIWEEPAAGYRPVLALAADAEGRRLAFGRGRELVIQDLSATNRPVLTNFVALRDAVRAVAWNRDGTRLAVGGFRELTVLDTATFQPVWSASTNLPGRIGALRFTPHGGALVATDAATGGSGWVRLFAADSGRGLGAWKAHADSIFDVAISGDGGLLATAGGDKLVKLWELLTQREVAVLEGHVGAVLGVAFNPGATELVSVGADKQLKLWDVATREAVVTMGGRKRGFTSVAWSADGSRVVAGDEEGRLTSFVDFKRHSGEQSSATATERSLGHWGEPLHALGVGRDGKLMVAGDDAGAVRLVDGEGKLLATFAPPATSTSVVGETNPPSFVYDILPMLSKAGCAAGACHAKADGQNGFKLSVFSFDPKADYDEVVKDARGRRLFPASPNESLVLLKATGLVEHGGGQRFEAESAEANLVRRWIRAGMPYQRAGEAALVGIEVEPREGSYAKGATNTLTIKARYQDGTERDVTDLADYLSNDRETVQVDARGRLKVGRLAGESVIVARFMGFVAASRVTVPADRLLPAEQYAALPVHNFIDELAYAKFRQLGLFPSEPCSDAEFLRRSSLDTIGVLPTVAEVREFLGLDVAGGLANDPEAVRRRREAWVERLLARPEFADFWANKWADLLRPNSDRVGVKSVYVLHEWLREEFRSGKPYDAFVRDVILAAGSNHRDGPVVVYRDRREPPELATMFGQLFLGIRMECAKCHHHPNEKWSQDDFYQFAAVFAGVKQKGAGLSPPISAGTESFIPGMGGTVAHPVTGVNLKPRAPDGPDLAGLAGGDARAAFAAWLTDRGNPFFARAAVNRVWAMFFGRGIVEPVDDFRVSNPASNHALLQALARDFAEHGYDPKHLVRTVLNSRLYQLSSAPNESNAADTRNFSRAYRRRLPAEVLLDAVNDITGGSDNFNGCPPGTRAMQTWSYKIGSQFMDAFGRPNASSDCPCERDPRPSVVQALHLMNSRQLQDKLGAGQGRVRQWATSGKAPTELVTEIYLAALGRPPAPEELRAATAAYGDDPAKRQTATEDVLWALLNSAEFVFNH